MASTTTMSELTSTLEAAWKGIQREHPDVPDALVVVGPSGDKKVRKLGHWAKRSWVDVKGERVHEVFISAERLERQPHEVFQTLIHEAGHALATAREIQDVSPGTQYHNGEYKKLAEELGLVVEKHSQKGRGWAKTTITPAMEKTYAAEIATLAAALFGFRQPELEPVKTRDKAKAKLSSAKSQAKWLIANDPDALAAVLADAPPEIVHAIATKAGVTCPHCGQKV